MNSIRNFFNNGVNQGNPLGVLSGMSDWMQRFQQFAQNPIGAIMNMRNVNVPSNFSGTPQDMVNYLVNSGQMSRDQLNQYSQMANQIQGMFFNR